MGGNVVNRGGLVQTRPGTKTLHCLSGERLQGGCCFALGPENFSLVSAVDGNIFFSNGDFSHVAQLKNVKFSNNARFIVFTKCLQSSYIDDKGRLQFFEQPKPVLIMQDGLSRAAYWDGSNSGHLDPTEDLDASKSDKNGTKIGLWSVWSNNRLWVSRGNQVFASDIGNPTKFTEAQYLNEARAFYMPGEVTGMIETPDQSGILVFTNTTTTFIQTSIQDRPQWLATPGFTSLIFPNIGCVAPLSPISQYGLVWWFSAKGVISFDAALRSNITSKVNYQDRQMVSSKAYIGPDMYGICAGTFENYLMFSVPSGSTYNRHTWVLDQSPTEYGEENSWSSIWTGWRPVQWDRSIVYGSEKAFFWSLDYDGNPRVWEAFLPDRKDNNCPITCWVQTKEHNFGLTVKKRFGYAQVTMKEVLGDVAVSVRYAGQKGAFNEIAQTKLCATEGQVYMDEIYGSNSSDNKYSTSRPQTRVFRTNDSPQGGDCDSCNVEAAYPTQIDWGFSLLVAWSGIAGLAEYRIYAYEESDDGQGECLQDEANPRVLAADGCSSASSEFVDSTPFTEYSATVTETVMDIISGLNVSSTKTATSVISQSDATTKASQAALLDLAWRLGTMY